MKPAVKPRTRPHSQYNLTSRGDENQLNEQTQMVNLRNNRRSLDCPLVDYMAVSGDASTVGGGTRRTGGDPGTAGGDTRTVGSDARKSGGESRAPIGGVDSSGSGGPESRTSNSGTESRGPGVPGTAEPRVAAGSEYRPPGEYRTPFGAYKPPPPKPVPSEYKGGECEYPTNSTNTSRTTYGTNAPSGGAPKPAIRPHKASVSDLDNPSGSSDSGNIKGYLTRPWNSENRPPPGDTQQRPPSQYQNRENTRPGQTGNIRRYPAASWNSSTEQEPLNSNTQRNRTITNNDELSQSRHAMNMLSQSQHSMNDTVDLNETTDLVRSRRNSDDSVSVYGLRRTSSVQAKRKFMMGSYIILFIGILLAVSGAVLTVLAFHNHFGHISIGQQWSLAGIVLMTIGICLLLTYTVTAAKNKYWAIQEDIQMENRGNYSRNLEQSSSVYIPAPYTRESRSEPPEGYYRATEPGAGGGRGGGSGAGAGYYRLTRESPSLHSSAAASTSQFTETSSVDLDEEPRQSVTPSHKRTKRKYNHRYDVAGHEVESDTQSEGSLHNPGERAGQGRANGGYHGRALRPAPGAPEAFGEKGQRQTAEVPDPTRSAPRVPMSTGAVSRDQKPKRTAPSTSEVTQPTRAAPAPPKSTDIEKTVSRNPRVTETTRSNSMTHEAPASKNPNPGVPDLIRTVPDHKETSQQQGQKRGTSQGQNLVQGQSKGQAQQEVKLRPAPVLPQIARQARMSLQPVAPQKVDLGDLPPHSETAMPLKSRAFEYKGGPQIEMEKKKGPRRPSPPNGGAKSQETQLNGKDSAVVDRKKQSGKKPQAPQGRDSTGRKPSRPAPDAPVSGTSDTVNTGGTVAQNGGRDHAKAKPTPAARMSKTSRNQLQQDYCCIEGAGAAAAGGPRSQCLCAAGESSISKQGENEEEGRHPVGTCGRRLSTNPRDGGHEGPYAGSSDDELAADGASTSAKPKPPHLNHKKAPPPTMKKPTLSYENLTPPEDGAPPGYEDSLKLPKK